MRALCNLPDRNNCQSDCVKFAVLLSRQIENVFNDFNFSMFLGKDHLLEMKSVKVHVCTFNYFSVYSPGARKYFGLRDHPFKTSACSRGGGV